MQATAAKERTSLPVHPPGLPLTGVGEGGLEVAGCMAGQLVSTAGRSREVRCPPDRQADSGLGSLRFHCWSHRDVSQSSSVAPSTKQSCLRPWGDFSKRPHSGARDSDVL